MPVLGYPPFTEVASGEADNLLGAPVKDFTTLVDKTPVLASLTLCVNQSPLVQQIQIDSQGST